MSNIIGLNLEGMAITTNMFIVVRTLQNLYHLCRAKMYNVEQYG